MCLVEVEKMPKLQVGCTLPVAEGMVVRTETDQVQAGAQGHARIPADQSSARLPGLRQGRRVRTAGHGLPLRRRREPLHRDAKLHVDGKAVVARWSSSMRRAASCAIRCVRVCNEGMGVGALGVVNRGVISRDRSQPRRSPGMRRVRRLHRHLPGRRADQRHLSLSRRGPGRWSTSAPSARTAPMAARPRWASRNDEIIRGNNRDRSRHQRRVPVHQGPLRVRFLRSSGAPAIAA